MQLQKTTTSLLFIVYVWAAAAVFSNYLKAFLFGFSFTESFFVWLATSPMDFRKENEHTA
jgi:hypothetical protein